MSYKAYTNVHYVLNREDDENGEAEYYFLLNQQGSDVHRVASDCLKDPAGGGLSPCNIMSGDYHGVNSDDYWYRVDAPVTDGSCKGIAVECTGKYEDEEEEVATEVDGSLYTVDYGVTVGKDSAPSSSDVFYVNDYDEDVTIKNLIVGRPVNLRSDPKYPLYDVVKHRSSSSNQGFSINNGSKFIDENGKLDCNIYISKGKLSLNWDKWSDTSEITAGADKPCDPEGSDSDYLTWGHECDICNARADYAEYTSRNPIGDCFWCYNASTNNGHPCGWDWENDRYTELENCLSKVHSDSEFTNSSSESSAISRYRTLCYDDCNKGETNFEDGHPNGASCKDQSYDGDGGRWSDLHHFCGTTDGYTNIKTPLNKYDS